YGPYEVEELEPVLGVRRSRIPIVGAIFAVTGVITAYAIIWFCNAYDFPLDVGGRPLDSLPADVPIMFETAVLFASLAIFVAMIVRSGMPRLHRDVFEIDGFERTSIDRFWIGIDESELGPEDFARTLSELERPPVWRRA
ncbi:MAG: DUF3341 domain-containing protein, partial [Polyangiaceae bacterium]